jgi:hypothetical protein
LAQFNRAPSARLLKFTEGGYPEIYGSFASGRVGPKPVTQIIGKFVIVPIGVAYTADIDRTMPGEIVNEYVSNQVN